MQLARKRERGRFQHLLDFAKPPLAPFARSEWSILEPGLKAPSAKPKLAKDDFL